MTECKIYKGYKACSNGVIYNKDGTLKKQHKNSSGYYRVDLCENGKTKRYFIHRLVAELFVENKQNKKVVNHIDGNKTNNDFTNLSWTTHSENNKHAYEIKLRESIKNPTFNAKLTEIEVLQIKKELKQERCNQSKIARKYGVSKSTISKINKGEVWRNVI